MEPLIKILQEMTTSALIFCTVYPLAFLVLLKTSVRIRRDFSYRALTPEEVPPEFYSLSEERRPAFERSGYVCRGYYALEGYLDKQRIITCAYRHPHLSHCTAAYYAHFRIQGKGKPRMVVKVTEFTGRYSEDLILSVHDLNMGHIIRDRILMLCFPGSSVEALAARFEQIAAEHPACSQPVPLPEQADICAQMREQMLAQIEQMQAQGYYRFDQAKNSYSITWNWALTIALRRLPLIKRFYRRWETRQLKTQTLQLKDSEWMNGL